MLSSTEMRIETGALRDYAALAEHHYLAGKPVAVTRVLLMRCNQTTASARFLGRGTQTVTAAVLVETMPTLQCKMRNYALSDRYGGAFSQAERAALLNDEMRCISRVVVHPLWRGQGLASQLVRHALTTATTSFTEALAAMGKVNPFFERAGMLAYHRPPHLHDDRLLAAFAQCGLRQHDLADLTHFLEQFAERTPEQQRFLHHEITQWSRAARGYCGGISHDLREQLQAAQHKLCFQPVYYLKDNRGQH